jgi:dTMP kinase
MNLEDSFKKKLQGKFITFEGGEGAGKSTQSKLLVEYLQTKRIESVWSREPGGSAAAEEIRNFLFGSKIQQWDSMTELLILFAARWEHTRQKILPLLQKGTVVVCDRYFDSSFAYQGYGAGLSLGKINALRQVVLDSFKPDLTIILDIDAAVGLDRACSRKGCNRYEDLELVFHQKVRDGFHRIGKENPNRCISLRVDDLSITQVTQLVVERVQDFFLNGKVS